MSEPADAQGQANVSIVDGTDLQDGDLVDVIGSGFTPGSTVFLLLCNDDDRLGETINRSALIGDGSSGYFIDATGRFVADRVPVPVGQVGGTSLATCPPSAAQLDRGISCSIQAATTDLIQVAGEPIAYVEGISITNPNTGSGFSDSGSNGASGVSPPGSQKVESPAELAVTGPQQMWLVFVAILLVTLGGVAAMGGWLWEHRRLGVIRPVR